MKIPAREVRKDMKIIDRDGYEILVTDTWPNQGEGLGVVVIGERVSAPSFRSFNRYALPDEAVEVISNG